METTDSRAIAIVGVGAVLPDASDVPSFWTNILEGRSSISEVPTERWDPALYYDPDPSATDRTYSKIGGWVTKYDWNPLAWRLPIPPKVSDAMDRTQRWAIMATREALADAGYPERPFDNDRTAVIFGNAMAGDLHYRTAMRIHLPEITRELLGAPSFGRLPSETQEALATEMVAGVRERFPDINEDTMPGELANIIAGRVANLFNFHGPNYVVDAACASAMAAITAAIEGLVERDYDVVLTGGIDSNMSASTFTKFCKIGALSATGTRPYADGADGFVMGEGAAVFVLKRLEDAERAGDRIYAVIRGVGGSSDGKGKGITAPNPIGQRFAIERGWDRAGVAPDSATLIEGHGTSTRVGDVIEVESLSYVFSRYGLPKGSLPLGSVKSNIGHLKGAAGAAGILKAALALHNRILPPSINCARLNPNVDFASSPLFVNREVREWTRGEGQVRRAGVSAFGFGGTNFHTVLEEHVPGLHTGNRRAQVAGAAIPPARPAGDIRKPMRGALVVGADSADLLKNRLVEIRTQVAEGRVPEISAPRASDLRSPERIAIDYGDGDELVDRIDRALKAIDRNEPKAWKMLRGRGIHRGAGAPSGIAFLFTGQGSQYANMLATMRESVPEVGETFAEADVVMAPILGKPLSDYVFGNPDDAEELKALNEHLRQTEITQPAVLTTDRALTRLLSTYGVRPDMVMGHSLGEYGALVAADALDFGDALRAVSARAHAMREVSLEDNGCMAAVSAPLEDLERLLAQVDEYVVIANLNSLRQSVIGGTTAGVEAAERVITEAGFAVRRIAVSHAFHTEIVAPASGPLTRYLEKLSLRPPKTPIVANVTGSFYPMHPAARPDMIDLLGRQIASPVQFVKGLGTLHANGIRTFVEVGPKRALQSFVEDVLGDGPEVTALFTNHPKTGDVTSFNQALCALYAAGAGDGIEDDRPTWAPVSTQTAEGDGAAAPAPPPTRSLSAETAQPAADIPSTRQAPPAARASSNPAATPFPAPSALTKSATGDDRVMKLGRMFVDFLERSLDVVGEGDSSRSTEPSADEPLVISGAALGLPGDGNVFDDGNVGRILRGESFIGSIPMHVREAMVAKHVTRLVKSATGSPHFESIEGTGEAIKLAGLPGKLDLGDYGLDEGRIEALNGVTQLALAVGLEALRDAGIPLVMNYRKTTKGTFLPDRWMLPEALRDETGIIFASAFPDSEAWADEVTGYDDDRHLRARLAELQELRTKTRDAALQADLDERIARTRSEIERIGYTVDRKLLFRLLSMGHSQFAEHIGARGPNSQINCACASTPHAVGEAEDWIRRGRCKRVIIISADNATSDRMMEWIGAGFLASGAAATDERVEDAVLPFDRRRHGMVVGMGAAALVVETAEDMRARGVTPICEILSTVMANSAFHGTRLDVDHMRFVMDRLVSEAETNWGIDRRAIAPETVFVSHETYTPARGGSAQAEVDALRHVFRDVADQIVMANTKGFTGHAMGAGIEDVVAVKALETGIVPPVANFREVDPDLGPLNLSKGGPQPVRFALRLGAGFGSQIAMTLLRWTPPADGQRRSPEALGYEGRVADRARWEAWLSDLSGTANPRLEVVGRTLRIRDERTATDTRPSAAGRAATAPTGAPTATTAQAASPAAPSLARPASTPGAGVPPQPAPPAANDGVRTRVMEIVAEVTGYPTDMLDPELDLEADLGIDTVKQAETFAAVRAAFDIPREDSLQLREFPTLEHVVGFVLDRRPDLAAAPPAAPPALPPVTTAPAPPAPTSPVPGPDAVPTSTETGTGSDVRLRVMEIVAEVTGYPTDMLDPELDLEADLGIDTVKQAETFAAVRAAFDIPREDSLQLREFPTLEHVVGFVLDRRPDLAIAPQALPQEGRSLGEPGSPDADPVGAAPDSKGQVGAIQDRVLQIVSDVTGYPPDMLDPELDLEADLGIDTVKQAETFAAVRAAFDIPRDDELQLREFPTLAHVVQFALDRSGVGPGPENGTPAVSEDDYTLKVVEIAAEITGYPPDMLDLDLDLEADLGIDTVKQAEMFASVRAAYGIERDESLQLRDFPTLADVVRFAKERLPVQEDAPGGTEQAASTGDGQAVADPGSPVPTGPDPVATRRVPIVITLPAASRLGETSVGLAQGDRVMVTADRGGVARALRKRLEARGVEVLWMSDTPTREAMRTRVNEWMAEGPIAGVYWLAALDRMGDLATISPNDATEALRARAGLLHETARILHASLDGSRFFIGATRLGGRCGLQGSIPAPLGGAVTGFMKALRRERPEAIVKTVDFEATRKTAHLADALIEEALFDPHVVEVGYSEGVRYGVGIKTRPLADAQARVEMPERPVFVVTGAAGSIVSAITADLAATWPGTFWLLDLAPAPDSANPDLDAFESDPDGLRRVLFERMKAAGERATPARVEQQMRGLERQVAARTAIRAVEGAGGEVRYRSLDLRDAGAVADAGREIAEAHGKVDVLLHAAGLEISHMLPDKPAEEFDLVFDVKAKGYLNLLSALQETEIGTAVVFSSIAGRFGNAGQTDYSAANELLAKVTASLEPAARGITIDWTAWAQIGMASRGSIPTMMARAGIDMLAPEAGIPVVRRELLHSEGGEAIIAEALGAMLAPMPSLVGAESQGAGPMTGRLLEIHPERGFIFGVELNPTEVAFLDDHRIDGTPVLPGVMGLEAFAETARFLFPDRSVAAIESVRFSAPFKFYRDEPRTVEIEARCETDGTDVLIHCRLIGRRLLKGSGSESVTVHFSATVRAAPGSPAAFDAELPPFVSSSEGEAAGDLYRIYFHGPAYQVVERLWRDDARVAAQFAAGLPPNHPAARGGASAAPRLIELAFQTAGALEMRASGVMGLPSFIRAVRFGSATPDEGPNAIAIAEEGEADSFDVVVLRRDGSPVVRLEGYRTAPLPRGLSEKAGEVLHALVG